MPIGLRDVEGSILLFLSSAEGVLVLFPSCGCTVVPDQRIYRYGGFMWYADRYPISLRNPLASIKYIGETTGHGTHSRPEPTDTSRG